MDIPFGHLYGGTVQKGIVLILIVMDIPFGQYIVNAFSLQMLQVLILIVMDIPFGH